MLIRIEKDKAVQIARLIVQYPIVNAKVGRIKRGGNTTLW